MSKTAVTAPSNNLPAHLQGAAKTAKLGNIDQSDLIIPRVKLLQMTSPEVTEQDGAKPGSFWHTIAGVDLGKEVKAIPIVFRKSFVLWSPRDDERGILARADDGKRWDNWQNEDGTPKSFQVKPKNSPVIQTYTLAATVAESGLDQFGTSIKGEDNSAPAASLTYQMMFYFPEFQDFSPALILNTRTAVKPAKDLISKLNMMPADHFAYQVVMGTKKETKNGDSFFNYTYRMDGFAAEEDYHRAKELFGTFGEAKWRSNDEQDETDAAEGGGTKAQGEQSSSKF